MAAVPEVVEGEIDLRQYVRLLWRRRWLVVGVTVGAAAVAYLAARLSAPVYEASTILLVRRAGAPLELPGAAGELLGSSRSQLQNYVELLKSRTVMERALGQLSWPGVEPEREAGGLLQAVTVQPLQNTDTIRVRVRLPDPTRAQALANALVDSFSRFNQEMNRLETRSAVRFIEEQLQQVRSNLQRAENAILRYKQRQRLTEPSEEAKALLDKLTELEKLQAETAISLAENSTRLQRLEAELAHQALTIVASRTISTNPVLQHYRMRLAELEVELSSALQRLAPGHPQIVGLRTEIDEIRRRMGEEVERLVSAETQSLNPVHQALYQQYIALQAERFALDARRGVLGRLIGEQQSRLAGLPRQELELARLLREQRVSEAIYVLLRTRYEELRIREAMVTADIRVVDPALTPLVPVAPRPLLNGAVGLFLGAFAGVGLVFLLEVMDDTIDEEEDLERLFGAPVLARIPRLGVDGLDPGSVPAGGGR